MDSLDLARLQFAITVGLHWLFVILTLGLAPLVAIMHTSSALARTESSRDLLARMTRFWGQLYVTNYALGIATGLVMEFQFGLAWSGLSKFAGNVFGAPLAMETLIAFFAESTFIGMWIFGWGRLHKSVHVTLIWLVTLTAYGSAYFILVANGFMQHPVGFETRDGVAYLTDFAALLTNPNTLVALGHVAFAALLTGGLFVAGVSAYHFLKHTPEQEFFRRSLRLGVLQAAIAGVVVVQFGSESFRVLARTQPLKLAALHGRATGNAVPARYIGPAEEVMTGLGNALMWIALGAAVLLIGDALVRFRPTAWVMVALIPFPFVASVGGWLFREGGRQPWLIYGQLTDAQAHTQISTAGMLASLICFTTVMGGLALTNWLLMARFARSGPEFTQLGVLPLQLSRAGDVVPAPSF